MKKNINPISIKKENQTHSKKDVFKVSFFNIRFKLLVAVVSLITISLFGMGYLSSYFFSNETKIRIQEFNLDIAQALAREMNKELNLLEREAKTIHFLYQNKKDIALKLFHSNSDYVFYSSINKKYIVSKVTSKELFSKGLYNETFLKSQKIKKETIKKTYEVNFPFFKEASQTGFAIFNASIENIPLLGICLEINSSLIVLYVYPKEIFSKFGNNGLVNTYMTDPLGNIVAHQNLSIYTNHLNASSSPLVKSMNASQLNSVQLSYKDTDKKDYLGSYSRIDKWKLGVVAYVEEDVVFKPVRQLLIRNFLITFIILILALIFIYFFAKTLIVPILGLMHATQEIERGQYDITITPTFKDEIGSLTYSFNEMAKGLGEREKIKDAFGRFVNKELVEKALKGEIKLGGEKKYASIFFSDLRGFTAISEKMSPEDIVRFLNNYFSEMVTCIDKNFGTVDKYIGDAIMAHWGALHKESDGNETENAINAALAMRLTLLEFNKTNKWPKTQIGCGINTGEVVSGQIGSENRLEYTVIGDTVNLASRIEALNKPFGTDILVSSFSYERVKDIFKFEKMPSIKVKGKENELFIYAVLGRKDDPKCPQSLNEIRKIIGISTPPPYNRMNTKEEKYKVIGN